MHFAAAVDPLRSIRLEIEVEMGQRVVLDSAGLLAQRFKFRQLRFRPRAPGDEPARDVGRARCSALSARASARPSWSCLASASPGSPLMPRAGRGDGRLGRLPANTSATCRASTATPSRASRPAILHETAEVAREHGLRLPCPRCSPSCASTMAGRYRGISPQSAPPKPQQLRSRPSSMRVGPQPCRATAAARPTPSHATPSSLMVGDAPG